MSDWLVRFLAVLTVWATLAAIVVPSAYLITRERWWAVPAGMLWFAVGFSAVAATVMR